MSSSIDTDRGFTLIELLVVMIIIGILATIAIPTFLSQRAKAHDVSTKADVANLGKEVSTLFIGAASSVTITLDFASTPGKIRVTDGTTVSIVNLTNGTASPVSGGSLNMNDATNWCVALTDAAGSSKDFKYSALGGLQSGLC